MKIIETHIVPAIENKIRLQEYAPQVLKYIPTRSAVKKAIKRKEILIDGRPGKTSDWIQEHQKIEVLQNKQPPKKIFKLPLPVVYEDEDFAIIDKPPGYPTSGNYFRTIENALPFNLKDSSKRDKLPQPKPVHRLDNPTSGLMIVAKTLTAQRRLHRDFENRSIKKTYTALVRGIFPETAILDSPINEKPTLSIANRLKLIHISGETFSLVEVQPETGRTHQIRIHLSAAGFPILGDREYGDSILSIAKELFLTATGLSLQHPITGKSLHFNKDLPESFVALSGS